MLGERCQEDTYPVYPCYFQRLWPEDPYAVQRTGALKWLGDRYLLARPINASRQKTQAV
jgi:hypothetical protein